MNKIIEQLQNHRTYRQFDETYQLPEEELQAILTSSRQAPTWMNGQFYDIIVVKDRGKRQQLVEWNPGNPHMLHSAVFLLFVADLKRTQLVAEKLGTPYRAGEGLDPLIVAVTDTALALENAVIAAESLGLGAVVVGSVRKNIAQISELFQLPDYVLPIAGVSIGKPAVAMAVKPRLPEAAVVHVDTYQPYDYQVIEEYVSTMEIFGEARETKTWTKKFADYFSREPNKQVDDFLAQRIFKTHSGCSGQKEQKE